MFLLVVFSRKPNNIKLIRIRAIPVHIPSWYYKPYQGFHLIGNPDLTEILEMTARLILAVDIGYKYLDTDLQLECRIKMNSHVINMTVSVEFITKKVLTV